MFSRGDVITEIFKIQIYWAGFDTSFMHKSKRNNNMVMTKIEEMI